MGRRGVGRWPGGRTTSATSWSSRTVTALQVDEPAPLTELELFQLVRVRLRAEVRAASAIASALDADDEEYRLRQIEVFRRLTKLATRPGSAP
jgi:hypothetical protein